MTYVTCPIRRYHPAVVAQKAATTALLCDDRFTLGLGAGENLNEHVVGGGWLAVNARHAMLNEAVEIISELFGGEYVNFQGTYFQVDSAKLWDLPETRIPIGIAVSGRQSCQLAGRHADAMIAVEPRAELGRMFDEAGGAGKPRVGQLPVSFDLDVDAAVARAHRLFKWFGGGWKVNAELPSTQAFEQASAFVRPGDVAQAIPCGSNVDTFVSAIGKFAAAGFTHVALAQVGGEHQLPFISWAEKELLPALREIEASAASRK
jgi:G6PDH family F420-dependent oxidoreductase